MKIEINETIEIPEGINVDLSNNKIKLKKQDAELEKDIPNIPIKKQDNKLIINKKSATKNDKKLIKTAISHIKNMIKGLDEKFTYKLQICSVHFPMTVEKKEKQIIVKNFLGEKKERKAKILDNVDVKIDKEFVIIESTNKESAGQTAANIETATKVSNRDRRRFQDGIWMVSKDNKEI